MSSIDDVPNGNCRGGWGESATSIDLTKLADLRLVHRAVVNGWEVPQHIREQIGDQLGPVLAAACAKMDDSERIGSPRQFRLTNQFLKLARLVLAMDARNMIDEGHRKTLFPYLRRRNPENRRPRLRPA